MKNNALSKWPLYLGAILITNFIFCFLVDFKTNPKKDETINFFVIAEDMNINSFENELLSKTKEKGIKKISTTFDYANSQTNNYVFNTVFDTMDAFVLNENFLNNNFESFSHKLYNFSFDKGDINLAKDDHGIIVNDKSSINKLSNYITYGDENYYLMWNVNSVHCDNQENMSYIIDTLLSM